MTYKGKDLINGKQVPSTPFSIYVVTDPSRDRMSVKVVLDTNFLLLASIFRGDVFEELDNRIGRRTEKIVLKPVYHELKRLSTDSNFRTRNQAETALQVIERGVLRVVDVDVGPSETVDELIARVAVLWKCLVATNDRALRKRLVKSGVPVAYLRQRNRVEVRGGTYSLL
jgi:rRNA-processing protein FCF1